MGVLLPALLWTGCSDDLSPRREAPSGKAPALYGDPARLASAAAPRAPLFDPAAGEWQQAGFCCIQTELSPATLYHASSKYLGVFTGMAPYGLGAPRHLAFSTRNGPRSFKPGQPLDPSGMEENWVLVWFAGAPGWTHWDSPWAVFLQHRPVTMKLDADGLHFEFAPHAGDVVLMPLYGYYKPPLEGNEFLARQTLPSQRLETWKWSEGLRTAPLMRLRYWASATREFPLYCEDTFSVDRAEDSLTIRQRFQFHSIPDDWHTQHLKVAPLSPPLALAMQDKDFPARISGPIMDYDYVTPYGPYAGIENADRYDVTFRLLAYVNETEPAALPKTNAPPAVKLAWEQLRDMGRAQFSRPQGFGSDSSAQLPFCSTVLELPWLAKALPYYDDATRSNALANLHQYVREQVLATNRWTLAEIPKGSGRSCHVLECPGNDPGDVSGGAARFRVNLLDTLWTYAHCTGDWDLIRERWDLVKQLSASPAKARWATFGGEANAPLGDTAAACLAMARLAYRVGDLSLYHYACHLFARELVLDWLKLRGLEYFRRHQPWHTMNPMDDDVSLTALADNPPGWQIESPNYPIETAARPVRVALGVFRQRGCGPVLPGLSRPRGATGSGSPRAPVECPVEPFPRASPNAPTASASIRALESAARHAANSSHAGSRARRCPLPGSPASQPGAGP